MRTFVALLTSALLTGAGLSVCANTTQYRLHIEPHLCVVAEAEQRCTIPLQLRWHSEQTPNTTLCLYMRGTPQPLFCDRSGRRMVSETLTIELQENTRFELREQDKTHVLAYAEVNIAHLSDNMRPRRRHGWGIF